MLLYSMWYSTLRLLSNLFHNVFIRPSRCYLARMTVQLVIELSEEVLKALVASKNLTITVAQAGGRGSGGKPGSAFMPSSDHIIPREGSLPARILDWAEKRSKPFSTADLVKRFKVSRAHASMLLTKLANGPYPIGRKQRGIYTYSAQ